MVDGAILNNILIFGPVFLLIAVRAFAMIQVAPLLSSDAIPQAAKFALAGLAAFAVLPSAEVFMADNNPHYGAVTLPGASGEPGTLSDLRYEVFSLRFGLLIIGEAIIGIILGFYLTIIFAAFSTAGQFFSLQMGFGASETFDPVAQVENPLMGQYFNLVSMLIFISIGGFSQMFLGGFWRSVQTINIISLIDGRESVVMMLASGLSRLFLDAIIISTPILGTLFLTSLTTGLISKAAPQINILSEGFPISIITAFLLLFASLPFMIEAFSRVLDAGFNSIQTLYIQIGRPITGEGI
ncbi:MAG: flagellar biosynthetic protein FliR [Treponema sp.]|nr:flagellar biosynthetic protein FliR [Treponema sp.]MCL2251349.1 flagellar biosynthetic protein FliR [Treponema sp.]